MADGLKKTTAAGGKIVKVSGPTVVAEGMEEAQIHHRVRVGAAGLLGEVIRLKDDRATIQVYEETTGLTLGEEVVDVGEPLVVELGPGLLTSIFDGIQRPLDAIRAEKGDFLRPGGERPPLSRERRWGFVPLLKEGDVVGPGDVIGEVAETASIIHRILVPPGCSGTIVEVRSGSWTIADPIALLEDGTPIRMLQTWPVRTPRPFRKRLPPVVPLITRQRVFDTLFPLAVGGTAVVPGGFGTGKTVVEQALAKYAEADIILFIGCGERGNEMAEVLTDFPNLTDPVSGRSLMERTILVVNTSNMPVAAREASIYTGITIAEYYRDMGYRVALMADSISRWAEALREIASRLEEMPGEEGYPTYLGSRLARFFERAGRVDCLGGREAAAPREGAATIVAAISPPGGDFSEPVTQSALRVAGALWALDPLLSHRRHYPAIDWKTSYSLYTEALDGWFQKEVADDWPALRGQLAALLQREEALREVVQLVGLDALQDPERITLDACRLLRDLFLRQSAFSKVDAACPPEKQVGMLRILITYHAFCRARLDKGERLDLILADPLREKLLRLPEIPAEVFREEAERLLGEMKESSRRRRTGKESATKPFSGPPTRSDSIKQT